MGRMSKRKGAVGEREAAALLSEALAMPGRFTRGRQHHGGPDSPDIRDADNSIHVEVKRTESLSLYTAMDQAVRDAGPLVPVVLHRRNGREWLAIVRMNDLLRLKTAL